MKALAIRRYKAPMEMMELPRPEPGPGDLLVRVRAASVNPVDYKIRDGVVKVLIPYSFPLILGNDLAGDVEAVGPGVTKFKVGDAIYSRLDKDRIGAIAEYALVRESAAAKKPARLDYVQAASLPLVGLTAWQALIDLAHLQAGQKVLIHAGSGGVGTFAIQLAKHLRAQVATTASAKNHVLVKSLGADVAIDYKTTRFEEVAKDQDVIFDTQAGDTLLRSFEAVKPGGVADDRRPTRRQVRARLGPQPAARLDPRVPQPQGRSPGQEEARALRVPVPARERRATGRDRRAGGSGRHQTDPGQDLSAGSRGGGCLLRGIGPRRRKSGHSRRGLV